VQVPSVVVLIQYGTERVTECQEKHRNLNTPSNAHLPLLPTQPFILSNQPCQPGRCGVRPQPPPPVFSSNNIAPRLFSGIYVPSYHDAYLGRCGRPVDSGSCWWDTVGSGDVSTSRLRLNSSRRLRQIGASQSAGVYCIAATVEILWDQNAF
jgi:hypothetical protein